MKDLHHSIQKHSIWNNISSTLNMGYAKEGRPNHCSANHSIANNTMAHAQSQIKWQQIYYSRYSPQWPKVCNNIHPSINSTHYFAKIITLTWQVTIMTWTIQNKHLRLPIPWRLIACNYKQQYNRYSIMCNTNHTYMMQCNTQSQTK